VATEGTPRDDELDDNADEAVEEPADEAVDDARARSEAAERRRRAGRGSAAPVESPEREPRAGRGGLIQFVRECWAELQRVQWPDRRHLWQATAVVILAVVVVGTYLYALDTVFKPLAAWVADKQAG
jgi:preprotein translocase SecE subunit